MPVAFVCSFKKQCLSMMPCTKGTTALEQEPWVPVAKGPGPAETSIHSKLAPIRLFSSNIKGREKLCLAFRKKSGFWLNQFLEFLKTYSKGREGLKREIAKILVIRVAEDKERWPYKWNVLPIFRFQAKNFTCE